MNHKLQTQQMNQKQQTQFKITKQQRTQPIQDVTNSRAQT